MAIVLERGVGMRSQPDEQFGLECPYCGVYSHITPQSLPDVDQVLQDRPEKLGLVYQCDACHEPIFLRFSVREYGEASVKLYQHFDELERPKERFSFSYLPSESEMFFREALSCYSNGNFNAFGSMCRRAAESAFDAMGENGKLRAFDEVIAAQEIAEIDDRSFEPVKQVLFDGGDGQNLPVLNRAQAGVLVEVLKDMFYQCFVRPGKLAKAIKVRQIFVQEGESELRPSA